MKIKLMLSLALLSLLATETAFAGPSTSTAAGPYCTSPVKISYAPDWTQVGVECYGPGGIKHIATAYAQVCEDQEDILCPIGSAKVSLDLTYEDQDDDGLFQCVLTYTCCYGYGLYQRSLPPVIIPGSYMNQFVTCPEDNP